MHQLAEDIAAKSPISLRAAKRALRQGSTSTSSAAWRSRAGRGKSGILRRPGGGHRGLQHAPRSALAKLAGKRLMSEHPHQFPQPVELPVDERESALPLPAQLTRFIITGGFSAIVDFGLLVILMALGLGHTPAKAISFIAGTTTAYLINRRWTFRASPSTRRFIAVVVLYAVTFALQVGLFSVLFTLLTAQGLSRLTVQIIAFVIAQGSPPPSTSSCSVR